MRVLTADSYRLDKNAEVTIEKYTFTVNSFFLTEGESSAKKKIETLIWKKAIRTIASSKQ